MHPLFRPLLASLLCGTIVLGHAPAWLHVGTCEGHGHASAAVAPEGSVSACSSGCMHHASSPAATETGAGLHDSGDHQPHDSDNCVTCQSLASPSGVTWELLVSLPSQFVSHPAYVASESSFSATLLSLPQPRGPPAAA